MLVETYVDPRRHQGTCYRAANWQCVGQTQARGAMGGVPAKTPKDVYVYPLHADWRRILQHGPPKAAKPRRSPPRAGPRFVQLWQELIGTLVRVAELWDHCRQLDVALPQPQPVSVAAICQARAKVDEEVFRSAHRAVLERLPQQDNGNLGSTAFGAHPDVRIYEDRFQGFGATPRALSFVAEPGSEHSTGVIRLTNSSRWRNSGTCPSMATRAPRLGSTASYSRLCWWKSLSPMHTPFPPGDTSWQRRRPRGAGRDFQFMLRQVTQVIEPSLALSRTLSDWNAISEELADAPRKRKPQFASYFDWPPNDLTLRGGRSTAETNSTARLALRVPIAT